MPLRPNMEPGEYLDILRRRKWTILFSVLLILFGAIVYCVLTPNQYLSTVKLIIIPPKVAEEMASSTVNIKTVDRLLMIRQDVLSRIHLMGLINEIGLSTLGFIDMSPDRMLATMRNRIIVDNDPKNKLKIDSDPNIFNLSFIHEKPQVAMVVASRLASFFVEENIKVREAVTQETSKFLASQVEETRKKLQQQEEKLKQYKIQFGGELPQQEQTNLNRLTRLQDQIKTNSESIARLADRKVFLQAQIGNLESNFRAAGNPASGNPKEPTEQKLRAELSIRRMKLEELNEKYTPFYPTVVQARREVELLEARIAKLRAARKGEVGLAGGAVDPSHSESLPKPEETSWESGEVQNIRGQIASIDLEMVALKRENANASHTIDQIQRKMERLPQREQEMISLSRDYDNLKRSYDDLLQKRLQSQISETLEKKQKGQQFQVLEPATLPTTPFKPDRLTVLGLALMGSLLVGAGGAIVYEMFDQSLRGSKDFKSFFDLPILASLPVIQNDQYKRRIAIRRAAIVGGLVSILGAYLVFLVIHGEKVKSILQYMGVLN